MGGYDNVPSGFGYGRERYNLKVTHNFYNYSATTLGENKDLELKSCY